MSNSAFSRLQPEPTLEFPKPVQEVYRKSLYRFNLRSAHKDAVRAGQNTFKTVRYRQNQVVTMELTSKPGCWVLPGLRFPR
jgi:hypothetical protein